MICGFFWERISMIKPYDTWMSRSEHSNKMSIQPQMFQVYTLQSTKIFSIRNLRMLDELQQNTHFHWHLSPLYILTKKISKNHRNILSHTVCALSSIAQTTPNFCNHEENSLNWHFPWMKIMESSMVYGISVHTFNVIPKNGSLQTRSEWPMFDLKCLKMIFFFFVSYFYVFISFQLEIPTNGLPF